MHVPSDRRLLYAAGFLRALATGMVGVLLGIHLATLRFTPETIGLLVAAGLTGAAVATLAATLGADRLGRRRFLLGLSLLGAAGGAMVAWASQPAVIALAAFAGMVNGMGRDRGASLVIEQAILPATTPDEGRTRAFAWYNVLQDAGGALGGLLAALPVALRRFTVIDQEGSLRVALLVYALLLLACAFLYPRLSPAVEVPVPTLRLRVSPQGRAVLWRIVPLFALDSLGGGLLTTALLAFFFHERFAVGEGTIGLLFFGSRVANALSHLGAAWLAGRIGLVNTMVFTHIPSSLLLLTVPFAPSFPVAAALFLVREGMVEMDVPTRQSYLMAVVKPEDRTFASGLTGLVRMGAWAVGPAVAGFFMKGLSLATPLFVGAGMKIVYDVVLWLSFRRLKPPEELTLPTG
ncbi:MAG: MFS transporter [Gemmatimonadetes bacterium]|nr:MFS transporter [Gemmatimonadota bacterium]